MTMSAKIHNIHLTHGFGQLINPTCYKINERQYEYDDKSVDIPITLQLCRTILLLVLRHGNMQHILFMFVCSRLLVAQRKWPQCLCNLVDNGTNCILYISLLTPNCSCEMCLGTNTTRQSASRSLKINIQPISLALPHFLPV